MNKRGFTLVEMLAVIAIMAILSGVAVMGVSRYLKQSKEHAYDTMFKSAYDAAANYILAPVDDEGDEIPSIVLSANEEKIVETSFLVENGYLEKLFDPNNKTEECTGEVRVKNEDSDSDSIDEYKYTVELRCPSGYSATEIFPKDSE